MNLVISAVVCLPALAAVLAIGLWVAVDQVAEARRRAAEGRHVPVVIDTAGRLVAGQVVAVGVAPVPPRSHRRSGWSR